jgi:hypothetical protein
MNDTMKIIKETQNEIKKDLENRGLAEFTDLTNNFIQILAEALSKKDAEIRY